MQRTEITFKGVNLTPYADNSPDGQLALSEGLELYNGSLRPSVLNGTRSRWAEDGGNSWLLLHIHTTPSYSNYIFYDKNSDSLCWADVEQETIQANPIEVPGLEKVSSVSSVGNTLVLFTSTGITYSLFENGHYKHIGMRPPEINLSFGLAGYWLDVKYSETQEQFYFDDFTSSYVSLPRKQLTFDTDSGQRKTIADKAFAAIGKAVEECNASGKFCQPFFVRAAYRRFDGSYTMLTPPVLMIPDSTGPKAIMKDNWYRLEANGGESYVKGYIYGRALAATLVASIMGDVEVMKNWTDIISGVDIFVTLPINVYSDNGEAAGLYGESVYEDSLNQWLGLYTPPQSYGIYKETDGEAYGRHDYVWMKDITSVREIILPVKNSEEIVSQLVSSSQFYKISSFSLTDYMLAAGTGRFSVLAPDLNNLDLRDVRDNLPLHESLPDSSDYQSHDTLIAERGFVYNRRLHLYDLHRILFDGFQAEAMFPYTNDGQGSVWHIYTYISAEDGEDRCVHSVSSSSELVLLPQFFYYPNPNAYLMVVQKEGSSEQWSFDLLPHPFLNGSYALWWDSQPVSGPIATHHVSNNAISTSGKVYTSEVDNPFYFPLEGIYTVGVGRILGISSVATALSQGQFGQFPLIIFCTDGNYALSVDNEGYYSSVHPTQRDVCINPKSVIQTDAEILYMSSRGVISTNGAGATCISTALDGVPENFPSEIASVVSALQGQPHDKLKDSLIAYDYASRRILFFLEGDQHAYIYSLNDGTWSTSLFGYVKSVLNYYPYAYIQFGNGDVMRLDDVYDFSSSIGQIQGVLYTRPVMLSTYQLKRIHQISVQGVFSKAQELFVYASNDGRLWHLLGSTKSVRKSSMRGRPFKYYRFGLITSLAPNEHITSIKVEFDALPESKLR